jgi:6-phosphofructokinase 2
MSPAHRRRAAEDGGSQALLVTADEAWRAPALPIRPASTVGAGDSFLGAMVWALAAGKPVEAALAYGAAGGAAALLTHGTELCRAGDVHRLVQDVAVEKIATP